MLGLRLMAKKGLDAYDNAAMNLSFAYSLTESCKFNNINPYDYWSDLIENVGKEGVDLNSFVHNQWQKHNK